MNRKHIYLLIALVIIVSNLVPLWAAYLENYPYTITQPDGSKYECFTSGDEYYHWIYDKNDFTIIQSPDTGYYTYAVKQGDKISASNYIVGKNDPGSTGLLPGVRISQTEYAQRRAAWPSTHSSRTAPSTGGINNIVIFIRFSDQPEFGQTVSTYGGWFNTNTSSLRNYILEASYDQLTVASHFYPTADIGDLIISVQSVFPRGHYLPWAVTNPIGYMGLLAGVNRLHSLFQSAINDIEPYVSDGLNIDTNNDGQVDNVVFVIAGDLDARSNILWPHQSVMSSLFPAYINDKLVSDYNLQIQNHLLTANVGVIAHEFGHSLGFPDLYHEVANGITPVGQWDVMATNQNPPQHMGAYMKQRYPGWISIPTITDPNVIYTINPLESSSTGNAYRINSPFSVDEFFTVECREVHVYTGQGFTQVPGLFVYRINTTVTNGNIDGPPDEIYIYRPGGTATQDGQLNNAFYGDYSSLGSSFVRTSIDHTTDPTPFLSDGTPGGLTIYNIGLTDDGTQMQFTLKPLLADFSAAPVEGQAPLAVNFSNQSVGQITSYLWNFGDGNTSTQENPTHVYAAPGTYTVSFTVSNGSESDTKTRNSYICVSPSQASLTAGGVTPPQGTIYDTFNFSVVFTSPAGIAPGTVNLVIGGQVYPMTASGSNWQNGVTFNRSWSTSEPGIKHYLFYAEYDGQNLYFPQQPQMLSFNVGLCPEVSICQIGDDSIRLTWNNNDNNMFRVYGSDHPSSQESRQWDLLAEVSGSYYDVTTSQQRKFFHIRQVIQTNPPPPTDFILVPGGTFNPTSSYTVSLSSFYIGKYEVTQSEYQAVMGINPSYFSGNPNRPVEQVSWFNAIEYSNRRSMQEGLTPAYSYSTFGTNPDVWPTGWNTSDTNHTNVSCNWSANGYRLPTEMEWMFAAKGGNQSQGYTYSGSNTIGNVAWYYSNSNIGDGQWRRTHDVGLKAANELGTFDMSGNVWEWVWDIYGSYPSGSQNNPTGANSGSYRVQRGGSWAYNANYCTVSFRIAYVATITNSDIGFRCVRVFP